MTSPLLLILLAMAVVRAEQESAYDTSLKKFERPSEIMACIHLVRHFDFSLVDTRLSEIMSDPNYQATRAHSESQTDPASPETLTHKDTREFLYILVGSCYETFSTLPVRTKQQLIEQANLHQSVDKELVNEAFDLENAFRIFSTMSGSELPMEDISELIEAMKGQAWQQEQDQMKVYQKAIEGLQDNLNSRLDTIESGRYLLIVVIGTCLLAYVVAFYSTRFCCNKIQKIEEKEVKDLRRVSMKKSNPGQKIHKIDQTAELNLLAAEEKSAAETIAKLEKELKSLSQS